MIPEDQKNITTTSTNHLKGKNIGSKAKDLLFLF